MSNKIQGIKRRDYLLLFLVLGASGNPAIPRIAGGQFLFLILVLLELVFFGKQLTKESFRKVVLWSVLFFIVFIGQYFTLGKISVLACLNYVVKFLIGLFAAFIFKDKFPYLYLRIMTFLTIISLLLWGLNVTGIYLPYIIRFDNEVNSLILYSQPSIKHISSIGVLRNFGMFWEPGAYAGYILIAFFLYINSLPTLWEEHRFSSIVLVLGLITTFSTTGYIILAVLLIVFLFEKKVHPVVFIFFGFLLFLGTRYAFSSISFLSSKIESEYENAIVMGSDEVNFSRIGAFLFDMQYIKMHPVFGNGLLDETRFSKHIAYAKNLQAFGNGFSGEIAYFGIPFMLFYLISVFLNKTLKRKWWLLLCLILLLQGEYFMNYPLFFIFPFVCFWQPNTVESDGES